MKTKEEIEFAIDCLLAASDVLRRRTLIEHATTYACAADVLSWAIEEPNGFDKIIENAKRSFNQTATSN